MPPVARTFPMSVVDAPRRDRYELIVDGAVAAIANYQLSQAVILSTYSELMPGFEGRGLGRQLARAVLDDVRDRGLTVVARCPFISTFIEDHADYGDLIDPPMAHPIQERHLAGA